MSPKMSDLDGCVNDARSIKAFLSDRLHTPESQIVFLVNEFATRKAILSNFRTHLIDNIGIQNGDTIVVYYAGHGSRVTAPADWPATDGKIETICPHDETMIDLNGDLVHGIPDRTINWLLNKLAAVKGNNIVGDLRYLSRNSLCYFPDYDLRLLPFRRYSTGVLSGMGCSPLR